MQRTHTSRILDAFNAAAPVTYRLLRPPVGTYMHSQAFRSNKAKNV